MHVIRDQCDPYYTDLALCGGEIGDDGRCRIAQTQEAKCCKRSLVYAN